MIAKEKAEYLANISHALYRAVATDGMSPADETDLDYIVEKAEELLARYTTFNYGRGN